MADNPGKQFQVEVATVGEAFRPELTADFKAAANEYGNHAEKFQEFLDEQKARYWGKVEWAKNLIGEADEEQFRALALSRKVDEALERVFGQDLPKAIKREVMVWNSDRVGYVENPGMTTEVKKQSIAHVLMMAFDKAEREVESTVDREMDRLSTDDANELFLALQNSYKAGEAFIITNVAQEAIVAGVMDLILNQGKTPGEIFREAKVEGSSLGMYRLDPDKIKAMVAAGSTVAVNK